MAWYITETQTINLHKREMEDQWDLYVEDSTLKDKGEPIKGLSTSSFLPGSALSPNPSWGTYDTKSRRKLYKQRNNL